MIKIIVLIGFSVAGITLAVACAGFIIAAIVLYFYWKAAKGLYNLIKSKQ